MAHSAEARTPHSRVESLRNQRRVQDEIKQHEAAGLQDLTARLTQMKGDAFKAAAEKIMETWVNRGTELKAEQSRIELLLGELRHKKEVLDTKLRKEVLRDYLAKWHKRLDDEAHELRKKRLIQLLIPMIRVHPNNQLELLINPTLDSVTLEDGSYAFIEDGGSDGT